MSKRYWLFKSEPDAYSIEDLSKEKDQTCFWDGVRNYQARNLLRDEVRKGDGVLFYHSRVSPMAVVGTCTVVEAGTPDPTQFDPEANYHDPKADPEEPRWYGVRIRLDTQLPRPVTLHEIKEEPDLDGMMLVQRGARLSVQPVTAQEWKQVLAMSRRKG